MLFKNDYTKLVKIDSVLLEQIKSEYPGYPIVNELGTYTNAWSGVSHVELLEYNTVDEFARTVEITIQRSGKKSIEYGLITNPNYVRPSSEEGINWASL